MVQLTRQNRYLPDIEFKKGAWIYNCFRLYELVFWRRVGVRAEASAVSDGVNTYYAYHTVEAALHNLEQSVRKYFKDFNFVPFKIYVPQLATPQGVVFASPYLFAIGFDTSGAADSGGDTGAAAVSLAASGANEKAMMFVAWEVAMSFSTLTVNGSASGVTQIGSEFSNATINLDCRCYYLDNPPTSSVSYALSASPSFTCRIAVNLYSGTATGAEDSTATNSAVADTLTVTTTVVASNCWLVGVGMGFPSGGNAITGGSGTTMRSGAPTTFFYSADSNGTVGTGSQSLIFNKASGTTMGGFVVSIAPSASGPANLKTYNTNLKANIKSIDTNLIANVKSLDTNT